jgi:radical SAM superfamily enzyme YgiQ (UPF0313 family)
LEPFWKPQVIDLNFVALEDALAEMKGASLHWIGLKVSAQNMRHAISTTQVLRARFPEVHVIWGGELPTLLPQDCLAHCDSVVSGAFEPVVARLHADLMRGEMQPVYQAAFEDGIGQLLPARLDLIPHRDAYPAFMGLPMESSRGCTYKCTFCMVHEMQPGYQLKTEAQLQSELSQYNGHFLNLIDYNFGVDEAHVLQVAQAIQQSSVLGWMGEMCIESLDNDRVLQALAASRCRMVYCGLEAVDELGLKSINKARTNVIGNYERIIRKAQAHGIQIAAGLIIGLDGASLQTMAQMREFFERMGLIYVKLTFITYNPGTKVKQSMLRKGSYTTEEVTHYDGNHLTFLANGLDPEMLFEGTRRFIREFYSLRKILRRSFNSHLDAYGRLEFILFNLCYRDAYVQWLDADIFRNEAAFQTMLAQPFKPSWWLRTADRWLRRLRISRSSKDRKRQARAQ